VQEIAADFFGKTIQIPPSDEYVANGAAKQAAWALSGKVELPKWALGQAKEVAPSADSQQVVSEYIELIAQGIF
jgi:xylulokinase